MRLFATTLIGFQLLISSQAQLPEVSCKDLREECHSWAIQGRCASNPTFVRFHCPVSCESCDDLMVIEESPRGPKLPVFSAENMIDVIGSDIGLPQILPKNATEETIEQIRNRVSEARDYIADPIMQDDFYKPVRQLCRNNDQHCAEWAVHGQCDENESFMFKTCAPVCFACEHLHIDTLCPVDLNMKNAWYPGDLNKMFERIVDGSEYAHFNTTVLSRPTYKEGDSNETATHMLGPWIITIDDFISKEEAETMIQLGADGGYEQSLDIGELEEDGTFSDAESNERTSTNAWCEDECYDHNVTRAVVSRIIDLIRIPEENSERLQMLRYEPGQFYGIHHDFIMGQERRAEGPRILTVFLYLNDVEEGGATNFSELDLAVYPKLGRVLIWPSVLDEDPHARDDRTMHEAQKVLKGIKYGANAWYHMRDHDIPSELGC